MTRYPLLAGSPTVWLSCWEVLVEPINGNSNIKPQAWVIWPESSLFNHHRTVCSPQPDFPINRSEIFRPDLRPMPQDWLRATHIITVSREPIPQVTGRMPRVHLWPSQPFPSLLELLLSIPTALPLNGHLPTVGVEQGRLLAPPILTASQTVFHIKRLNLTSIA